MDHDFIIITPAGQVLEKVTGSCATFGQVFYYPYAYKPVIHKVSFVGNVSCVPVEDEE